MAYLVGAGVMIFGGVAEFVFGVAAEQQPLEDISTRLSEVDKKVGGSVASGVRPGFARAPYAGCHRKRKS